MLRDAAGAIDDDDNAESEIDEPESGERCAVKLPKPTTPSADRRIAHALAHLPLRSWCAHCEGARQMSIGAGGMSRGSACACTARM